MLRGLKERVARRRQERRSHANERRIKRAQVDAERREQKLKYTGRSGVDGGGFGGGGG